MGKDYGTRFYDDYVFTLYLGNLHVHMERALCTLWRLPYGDSARVAFTVLDVD